MLNLNFVVQAIHYNEAEKKQIHFYLENSFFLIFCEFLPTGMNFHYIMEKR